MAILRMDHGALVLLTNPSEKKSTAVLAFGEAAASPPRCFTTSIVFPIWSSQLGDASQFPSAQGEI